jgi:hypothetical protein
VVSPPFSAPEESASSEEPMGVRGGGWEKAQAVWSGDGDGWRQESRPHHPTRKRADCPAVSRPEQHGGIDKEGEAQGGGRVPRVLPAPQGQRRLSRSVQPAGR